MNIPWSTRAADIGSSARVSCMGMTTTMQQETLDVPAGGPISLPLSSTEICASAAHVCIVKFSLILLCLRRTVRYGGAIVGSSTDVFTVRRLRVRRASENPILERTIALRHAVSFVCTNRQFEIFPPNPNLPIFLFFKCFRPSWELRSRVLLLLVR